MFELVFFSVFLAITLVNYLILNHMSVTEMITIYANLILNPTLCSTITFGCYWLNLFLFFILSDWIWSSFPFHYLQIIFSDYLRTKEERVNVVKFTKHVSNKIIVIRRLIRTTISNYII